MHTEQEATEDKTTHITVGVILSWTVGVLLLISGIGLLFSSPIAGLLTVIGGLIMLPPVSEYSRKQSGVHLSGGVRFLIAVVFIAISAGFMSSDSGSSSKNTVSNNDSTTTNKSDEEQVKAMEIVDISTRVTESNSVWSKFAWNLTLKNNTDRDRSVSAEIKWVDKDGFVVDTDNEYSLTVPAHSEKTFNDFQLIDSSVVSDVEGIEAEIH